MEPHPYGWLSLLPPLVAIVLAIATRRAVLSLLIGIFCGALVTCGGQPLAALFATCEVHLWPTLAEPGKLRVFCFTMLMGAMIGVICRSGGMQGLVGVISPFAKTRRSGQLITWLLGLVIFFDDYANTMLLGNTLRPLFDRLKISREKLAYLVDSTAAPVAGLALVSTWVAVEIDCVREGLLGLGPDTQLQAVDLFIASIPYRFYVVMALLLVPMIAFTGRDFGPMLKAERRRLREEDDSTTPEDPLMGSNFDSNSAPPARWYNAVLPIGLTLATVMALLYFDGVESLGPSQSGHPHTLREILGSADSSLALQYGSLAGLALAILLAISQKLLSQEAIADAVTDGVRIVLPAILILWCASAMSRMTSNKSVLGEATSVESPYEFQDHRLYTGDFLTKVVFPDKQADSDGSGSKSLSPNQEGGVQQPGNSQLPDSFETRSQASDTIAHTIKLLPTGVFLLAALTSFSTGTSFGTMGILMPMIVTLAHSMLQAQQGGVTADDPILLACIGSVLAGAIFGDHCSPISDTTILSSQSCGCEHIAHVVTQLPYALTVAGMVVVFGTLPLGWGVSVWLLLPLQLAGLVAVLLLVGKKVDA